jgi:NAD(P)-dependent dehydrogenase (short-subunit alcohol dehydrogenase family)
MVETVLILGGYGAAGLATARLLLRETPLRLVLAGRDGGRAAATAAELADEFGADRAHGLEADATDPASVGEAMRSCDLALVCVPLEGIAALVVQAAIEAGVDWIDISVGPSKQRKLRDRVADIERSGHCFITEAGAIPGLPSALVRLAADRFEHVRSAAVSTLMKESGIALGSALDLLRQVSEPASVYEDGEWRRVGITKSKRFDFGEPFGERSCFPIDLIEMRELPQRLGLEWLGVYGAGVDPVIDLLVAAFALGKLGRMKSALGLGARLMVWANRRFTKPPFGVRIKLEAEGTLDGADSRLDVLLAHEDGYEITAIPLVACVLQLLDGSIRRPGLHTMGSAVDPERLLDDMRRLGLQVSGL